MIRGLLAALSLGFALPAAAAVGEAPGALRIVTWNVRNYLAMDRLTADGFRPDYPKPEVEKRALRRTVHELEPHLLLLQEIGGESYLRELQRDLRREGLDYPSSGVVEADDTERQLGYLARIPLQPDGVTTAALAFTQYGEEIPVKRGVLELETTIGGERLRIYTLHLKSRYSEDPQDPESEKRRAGEATAVRNWLLERTDPAGIPWLVAGDFNDHPASSAVRRFLRKGDRELGRLLPASDERGDRWTHHYQREDSYSRVDLGIASVGAFEVFGFDCWIADSPDSREASDHRPLVIDLSLRSDRP